jgi:hypothetical protein
MQVITPKHGSTEGLDLTPATFTAKDGKNYYLIDARSGLAAAKWQLVHHYRIIEGAFRDQFNPKRKTNSWKVLEVGA